MQELQARAGLRDTSTASAFQQRQRTWQRGQLVVVSNQAPQLHQLPYLLGQLDQPVVAQPQLLQVGQRRQGLHVRWAGFAPQQHSWR